MEPYGDNPLGKVIFDNNGNFVAQLMKSDRKEFEADNQFGGTPEEIKEAFEGYTAYYGTYEVKDYKTLVNKVEGSLYPNWIVGVVKGVIGLVSERIRHSNSKVNSKAQYAS